MPLVAATLTSALADLFASMPGSPSEAADALAQAYVDYASEGVFGASTLQVPPVRQTAFASTLQTAIATPATGSPATFAAAWASAVTAFWVGVPVAGGQAGATVACPGAATLTAILTALFANLANTSQSCAQGLATALDTATRTVTAAVAPPPGTVLPIG